MPGKVAIELLSLLDTVVIEQNPDGSFKLLDYPPDWFKRLSIFLATDGLSFEVKDELSFLGNFVIDATEFWETAKPGQILWSAPCEQGNGSEDVFQFEAGAMLLEDKKIIIVRLVEHHASSTQETLQKARENLLAFEDLFRNERDLQVYKAHLEKEVQKRTEQLANTLKGVKQAIARTLEIRDPYTAGHEQRVAQLASAIAKEMRMPEDQINCISLAAELHDIGKIQLPIEILSKPGRLTDLEFGIIKNHSEAGYEILKSIDFQGPIAQIVLQHHERINGSGYPSGLSGEEILVEAKILGVADVVEAMSSDRPYRPALGMEAAIAEISEKSGVLYDVDVANACLRVLTQRGFQFES